MDNVAFDFKNRFVPNEIWIERDYAKLFEIAIANFHFLSILCPRFMLIRSCLLFLEFIIASRMNTVIEEKLIECHFHLMKNHISQFYVLNECMKSLILFKRLIWLKILRNKQGIFSDKNDISVDIHDTTSVIFIINKA